MQSLTHFPFFFLLTELNGVHYLAPIVQKVDSTIGFPNTYPLESDLSDG